MQTDLGIFVLAVSLVQLTSLCFDHTWSYSAKTVLQQHLAGNTLYRIPFHRCNPHAFCVPFWCNAHECRPTAGCQLACQTSAAAASCWMNPEQRTARQSCFVMPDSRHCNARLSRVHCQAVSFVVPGCCLSCQAVMFAMPGCLVFNANLFVQCNIPRIDGLIASAASLASYY